MNDNELDELKNIFLEECRENVDVLEQGLLQLGQEPSIELLNEVFRAAHSIKGGGATFGFEALAELTHHMETLLDEMRAEKRSVEEDDLELLLESVDIVRELMEARGDTDHADRIPMQERLESSVARGSASEPKTGPGKNSEETSAQATNQRSGWVIRFAPKRELLERGNNPLLMVRELKALGDLTVEPALDSLPSWNTFEPKQCYLSWSATLLGDCEEQAIRDIFDWVEFDCDLHIERLNVDIPLETTAPMGPESDLKLSTDAPAQDRTDEAPSSEPDNAAPPPPPPQVTNTAAKEDPKKSSGAKKGGTTESSSVRISTEKIDQLINLVGELVITQSMLNRISSSDEELDIEELRDRLADLDRNTRELQESIMRVRMLPLASGFNRLPRMVRDLSRKLDKKVELVIEGGETEIDKTVLERMMDPLVHLVRNALDHGLETPEKRLAAGKSEIGELKLNAYHQSGSVVIEISDDGAGISREGVLSKAKERGVVGPDEVLTDEQIHKLIFAPGFSTAKEVSDVSGRGVGMDVVRRNIIDLGGHVDIRSEERKGTTIIIRLPLTLAILNGQLITVCGQTFIVPLLSIIETIEVMESNRTRLPNGAEVFEFRDEYVPLVRLGDRLKLKGKSEGALIVVIENHGQLTGLLIDNVLGQQQAVIKSLDDNYRAITGIAGATIMSDGSVALILDPTALSQNQDTYLDRSGAEAA